MYSVVGMQAVVVFNKGKVVVMSTAWHNIGRDVNAVKVILKKA